MSKDPIGLAGGFNVYHVCAQFHLLD
nr:hypothetical protein [Burkholderia sp. AU30280]